MIDPPKIEHPTLKTFRDLTNKEYGKLTVLYYVGNNSWLCECDCIDKNKIVVTARKLYTSQKKSCGCKYSFHNMAGTPEYQAWYSMQNRCYNKNYISYPNYGDRGIKICERWKKQFENFLEDMGLKPDVVYSLDRIDNEGNYSCGHCDDCITNGWPSNCKWATRTEQNNNARSNISITYNGKTQNVASWAKEFNISKDTLGSRLKRGWDIERALTEPVKSIGRTITFNGKTMRLCEWEKETGISVATISSRIQNGWTIEDALYTPLQRIRKKKQ